ncbi:MAG: 50S ribosomal protein L13 [Deltaproteobacteria bacterium GWC2_42_11]|nr:MAG: 50S ribosomal protein L13 [Deltaproteobacteria bacterium GWC2_42_11]HBO84104.1 50S ribosomal protein L13 [Deltaproteobacteria bacterium]
MKTTFAKKENEKKWLVVDASGKVLGRLASKVATVLRGKHKPSYTPFIDMGDFVIVVNAKKVAFTGKKDTDKIYYHHTMYPGGLRATSLGKLLAEQPEKVIMKAVRGMLPKGRLGRDMLKKLKVYAGTNHPHEAQKPETLSI